MEDYMFPNQECRSGCESGWTLYLDHSSISPNNNASYDRPENNLSRRVFSKAKRSKQELDEDEDEDLSMVSDASSGPPHVHEEDGNDNNRYVINDDALSKNRENRRRINNKVVRDRDSLLDDTASSPLFDFSNKSSTLTTNKTSMENVLEYSQGYSTTQFDQVRQPYQQQYDDFFQSSQSGVNQLHQQNQW